MSNNSYAYDRINQYFEQRGLKRPTAIEAILWAITELGEVAEHLLAREGGWARNHPENKPQGWDPKAYGEELGDVIMMLIMAGMAEDVDPVDLMYIKVRGKLEKLGLDKS